MLLQHNAARLKLILDHSRARPAQAVGAAGLRERCR